MGFVNKVMLMGNTTRDPELRQLPSGTTVCDFAMATNRVYKTTAGEEKQETVFVDCTAFGRTGEVIAEYCPKGRPLFVEGRLHFETWEDKGGNRRSKLSVIVENFQFVGGREGAEGGPKQRELPLSDAPARRFDDRPAGKSPAVPAPRRGVTGGDRFEAGQRPDGPVSSPAAPASSPHRAQRKAGKLRAGAAVGAGAPADSKAVDQMADAAQQMEDADLPF
jgi:single-strand DNA-binding protein